MKKRTNWSTDAIINAKPVETDLNGAGKNTTRQNTWDTTSGLSSEEGRDNGWSGFAGDLSGWNSNNRMVNNTETRDFGNRDVIKIAVWIIAAILAVILIGSIIYSIPEIISYVSSGMVNLVSFLLSSAIIAFIIWLIMLMFVKKFLSVKIRVYSLGIIFVLTILCRLDPELGSVAATILCMILGIGILVSLIVK